MSQTWTVLAAFLSFAAAGALIVLLPGPDTLVVLRSVVVDGRGKGIRTVMGVLTGLAIWVTAAAFGLTALLRASHDGYLMLRLVGAAYLLYVGVQALRSRVLGRAADAPPSDRRVSVVGRGFRAGITTDLLNPKVGIFFVTFLPAFIPRHAPILPVTLGLGAIFVIETAIYFAVLVAGVDRLAAWLGDAWIRRRIHRATGVVLIGFGLRMAAEG